MRARDRGLLIASRLPCPCGRSLPFPSRALSSLQLLVASSAPPSTATATGSASRWSIQPQVGQVRVGPSGALARRPNATNSARSAMSLVPHLVPEFAIALALVLLGGDLGTSIIPSLPSSRPPSGARVRWFRASAPSFFGVIASVRHPSPNRLSRFDDVVGSGHRHVREQHDSPYRAASPSPTVDGSGSAWAPPREMAVAVRAAQRLHLRHHR